MKIKYFLLPLITFANPSSDSSLLSDDEDFLEASGDDSIVQEEIDNFTETTATIVSTFSAEYEILVKEDDYDSEIIPSKILDNDSSIYDEELITFIPEFFPNAEEANDEIVKLEEEIIEHIVEVQYRGTMNPIENPIEKMKMDERNQEKWDMLKWITFSSVISGFLLICATIALLIRRYQQKDRGSYEIMTPFEYQKGNREAFA